jgi:hypothetical protein
MNVIQKKLSLCLAACLAVVLFSCNNTEKKQEPAKAADTAVATTTAPAAPAAFTPFDMVEINHSVKDYAKWKVAFDNDSAARKASGLGFIVIGKNNANPSNLTIAFTASDVSKAKAFTTDPRLKDVMEKNGVTSKPEIGFYHVLRFNAESKEKQWVLITHKVKDFDAWLKVFDAEGTAARASFGMVDVVLARSIDDPSIVHLVFDIKDMAKAKARINSPELKKTMMDGGVEGMPKIEFYTTAE